MILSVCLVTASFDIGGAETHILTLAKDLARKGHHVTVVSGGGIYEKEADLFKHIRLPLLRKRSFFTAFWGLRKLFHQEKFDIIHVHARMPALICHLLGVRFVSTAHWVFSTKFPKRLLSFWGKECLAVSADIKRYLITEYGIPEKKITVTLNGIDTSVFRCGERQEIRRVCLVSRLDKDRSYAAFCLLRASEKLFGKTLFRVTVVGNGKDFDELKRLADEINERTEKDFITMIGASASVEKYLSTSDIFVGVSRAALEAMACECAVILAGNEGYLSIFDPENAEIAEESNFCCRGRAPTDEKELEKDLFHLLSLSQSELAALGKRNRSYVKTHYSAERMTKDALSVYESVIKEKAVLCGYYGFGNVGDELLHQAISLRLKEEGYREIKTLSLSHFSLSSIYAMKKGCDFFLGGGNLLQNETSRRSLLFYTTCMRFARRHGCKVQILSSGFGRFHGNGEEKAKEALRLCHSVECRTWGDYEKAKKMGISCAILSADAVLSLTLPQAHGSGEKILLAFRSPSCKAEALNIAAYILKLSKIYGKENLTLCALHPKDIPFAKKTAKRLKIDLLPFGTEVFLQALQCAHAVYSNRLHAGICALKVGVLCYLLKDEEKSRFFADDVQKIADTLGSQAPIKLFSYSDIPKKENKTSIPFSKICEALNARKEDLNGKEI